MLVLSCFVFLCSALAQVGPGFSCVELFAL
jgi:hypothetical protein